MLKIDLHLHTIVSGHAYNTILEYIDRAKKLKMKTIGFSEHGPAGEDVFISELYFRVLYRLPRIINGIRVLNGVEANILNIKGEIDISRKTVDRLDYVIAGFHKEIFKDLGRENNTIAAVNCIKSGNVNIISHPFVTEEIDVDIEKLSQAACDYDVLLEVNLHYLKNYKIKPKTIANELPHRKRMGFPVQLPWLVI